MASVSMSMDVGMDDDNDAKSWTPLALDPTATQQDRSKEYEIISQIGSGQYAQVFQVKRRNDGALFALKKVNVFNMPTNDRKECMNEAKLLYNMRHPNIIEYVDSFFCDNELYIVLELAEGGDLRQRVQEMLGASQRFNEVDIWTTAYSVAAALCHMHQQKVVHRDIKPDNVYITNKGGLKVGDLGLGRVMSSGYNLASMVGTPYYMSPEVVQGQPYGAQSDMWSLGCLLYECAMLQSPFALDKTGNMYALAQKITKCDYVPLDRYSDELKTVITSLLAIEVSKRPSAQQVCEVAKSMIQQQQTMQLSAQSNMWSGGATAGGTDQKEPLILGNDQEQGIFEDLGTIGTGKYSVVHRARHVESKQLVAVKRVQIFDMESDARKECVNETRLLRALPSHPNIIEYYDSFLRNNELFLILELAEGGDLHGFIRQRKQENSSLTEHEVWHIFVQVCAALQVMHSCRVMHRDIKPQNVFLTGDGVVKLGDLGLGRFFSSKTHETFSVVGTPYYMSPEAVRNEGYGFRSDVWGLGCLLYEMVMLRSPFETAKTNFYILGKMIQECQYDPIPSCYSDQLRALVKNMLQPKASDRPEIHEVYQTAQQCYATFLKQQQQQVQATSPTPHQPLASPVSSNASTVLADDVDMM